jgi:outer membrane protein TolC
MPRASTQAQLMSNTPTMQVWMKRFWSCLLLNWVPLAIADSTHLASANARASANGNASVASVPGLTGTNAVRSLSLAECVRLAVQHNFDVKIEAKGVDIARHRLRREYGVFDPMLRTAVTRGDSLSPDGVDELNRPFDGTKTENDTLLGGLTGLLPTGLEYELEGQLQDSNWRSPDGKFENTDGGAVIRLRQPLLKNFWIDEPRLNIQVNRKRLRISELAWRGQLMETVTRVEVAFYNLLLARENVKVQEQALTLARELLSANRERIRQGVLAALDEKQAESQVSAQQSLLLVALGSVNVQQNVLKGLMSDRLSEWADVTIEPSGNLTAEVPQLHRAESWQRGLAGRPDLLQAREDLERLGYVVKFNRNQLFPQLDAIGTYGHGASGAEFSTAFGQIRRGSSPFHTYGLQMTVPLSRRGVREEFKASKGERDQSDLRLRQLEQEILLQIDDAVNVARTDFARVGTTRQAREFAEAALQAEQTKMDNGKSTSFVVLQLQRDLTTARSEEIRALAEYNQALAQLALREGSVLDRHRLTVDLQ